MLSLHAASSQQARGRTAGRARLPTALLVAAAAFPAAATSAAVQLERQLMPAQGLQRSLGSRAARLAPQRRHARRRLWLNCCLGLQSRRGMGRRPRPPLHLAVRQRRPRPRHAPHPWTTPGCAACTHSCTAWRAAHLCSRHCCTWSMRGSTHLRCRPARRRQGRPAWGLQLASSGRSHRCAPFPSTTT